MSFSPYEPGQPPSSSSQPGPGDVRQPEPGDVGRSRVPAGAYSGVHRRLLKVAAGVMVMMAVMVWANALKTYARASSDAAVLMGPGVFVLMHLVLAAAVWRARFLRTALVLEILYGVLLGFAVLTLYEIYSAPATALGGMLYPPGTVSRMVRAFIPGISANAAAVGLILYVLVMHRRQRRAAFIETLKANPWPEREG